MHSTNTDKPNYNKMIDWSVFKRLQVVKKQMHKLTEFTEGANTHGYELQELFVMDSEVLIVNYIDRRNEYALVIDRYGSQVMLQDYIINISESHEVEMLVDFTESLKV